MHSHCTLYDPGGKQLCCCPCESYDVAKMVALGQHGTTNVVQNCTVGCVYFNGCEILSERSIAEVNKWLEKFEMKSLKESTRNKLNQLTIHARKLSIVEGVVEIVCDQLDIPLRVLMSSRRTAKVVWARHAAISLCHELTELSHHELAGLFNRKDHGASLHAVHNVRNLCSTDKRKRIEYAMLKKLALKMMKT